MPSVALDLGKFVRIYPARQDGTHPVVFEVPARLRPPGWPSSRPLPIENRRGDLTDAAEVARIQADAKVMYDQLLRDRAGREPVAPTRTMRALANVWRGTQAYKALKPRTQRGYEKSLLHVLAWAEAMNEPDPTILTKPQAEQFLALLDGAPTTRRHVKIVLKMLMDQAVDLGWRADNPVARIKMAAPKTKAVIWEAMDVETYAWAALAAGQPGMAALILMEWEIGQRLTDAYLFRAGAEYLSAEGLFQFEQSKTDEKVAIPVSDRLRGILDHVLKGGDLYLFRDARTGSPWARLIKGRLEADDVAASKVFASIRKIAEASGARSLKLKELRHSCVVALARAGCTVPEIASITGHSLASVEQILQRYLPRDSTVARNAQAKRGLVERTAG